MATKCDVHVSMQESKPRCNLRTDKREYARILLRTAGLQHDVFQRVAPRWEVRVEVGLGLRRRSQARPRRSVRGMQRCDSMYVLLVIITTTTLDAPRSCIVVPTVSPDVSHAERSRRSTAQASWSPPGAMPRPGLWRWRCLPSDTLYLRQRQSTADTVHSDAPWATDAVQNDGSPFGGGQSMIQSWARHGRRRASPRPPHTRTTVTSL